MLFQIQGALNELADRALAGGQSRRGLCSEHRRLLGEAGRRRDERRGGRESCFEATRSCSTGGVYINFLTEEEGADRIEAAYGRPILERLAALKRKYDPDNLFRHTKSVISKAA